MPEEYKKKKSLKIGRVSLDMNEKKKMNGDHIKNIIIIKPDPDQGPDNKEIARNWINNTFLKNSPYRSGIVSFSEKEWKEEKGGGDKFIQGIRQSPHAITWIDKSESKRIMKGLKALLPAQMGMNPQGMDPMGGLGGAQPGGSPFGGGELAAGLGTGAGAPSIGNVGGVGSPGDSPVSDLAHASYNYPGMMTFKEYIDKTNKRYRKSGPVRKIGIKTALGNPRLSLPSTGNDKIDAKRRYKELGKKF